MVFSYSDLYGTSPILAISATALIALVVKSAFRQSEKTVYLISVLGFIASIFLAVATFPLNTTAFSEMVLVGGYASFFDVVFLLAGLFTIVLSSSYLEKTNLPHGEYHVLVMLSVAGMMMMGGAADLIMVFIGLELMSVCFYVLAGINRSLERANEAALKYFLLGAFATGFLLYGIALIYGTAGTTNLMRIASQYPELSQNTWHLIGFGFLLIGFAFKVAAVPFHMWVPDVYEGSPTPIAGLMSTGGKAGAFAALVLTFAIPMTHGYEKFSMLVAIIAASSMVLGNLFGLAQTNIKRMLAYSSIAHAGYMLIGIAAGKSLGQQGILFYLVSYMFTNIGAFGVIALLEKERGEFTSYTDYAGLSSRKPLLAGLFALFMFTLIGIPPFSGFIGKYYLFASAVQAHMTWLAVLGVVTSLISTYYYLRVVVVMYFNEPGDLQPDTVPLPAMITLVIAAACITVLGILPSIILNVTKALF